MFFVFWYLVLNIKYFLMFYFYGLWALCVGEFLDFGAEGQKWGGCTDGGFRLNKAQ